ncbi:hypothetical protein GCM10009581_43580 [Tsukamurella strandjordii]
MTGPADHESAWWEWTPLAAPAHAGAVARESVAVVTENPNSSPEPTSLDRLLAESPSIEVISSAWMMLMSAAAEKLGLSSHEQGDGAEFDPRKSPHFDLDEARRLITALAGLTTASVEYLGPHAGPYRDGLKSLQLAFREYSSYPDEPGQGPGEKYTGPVYG